MSLTAATSSTARNAGGNDVENLYWRPADGSGTAGRLTTNRANQASVSGHPTVRFILYALYAESLGAAPTSLWVLPLEGSPDKEWTAGTPRRLGDGTAFEALGAISPDGRLVAYMSSVSGSFELYVRPLEGGGAPWRVSTNGGARELVFSNEDQILTAPYRYDGRTFTAETPRPWSAVRYASGGPTRKWDLHPDGARAIVASPDTTGATAYDEVVFVLNFFDELERLLASRALTPRQLEGAEVQPARPVRSWRPMPVR